MAIRSSKKKPAKVETSMNKLGTPTTEPEPVPEKPVLKEPEARKESISDIGEEGLYDKVIQQLRSANPDVREAMDVLMDLRNLRPSCPLLALSEQYLLKKEVSHALNGIEAAKRKWKTKDV